MSKRNLNLRLTQAELFDLAVIANGTMGRKAPPAALRVPREAFINLFMDHNRLARFASDNGVDVDALPTNGVRA